MNFNQVYLPKQPPTLASLPLEIIFTITDNFVACKGKPNNRSLLALSLVSRPFNSILSRDLIKYNVLHMGSSGLGWAVSRNNMTLAKKLLKSGGNLASAESGYPLAVAVKKGNVDMLKFLLATASKDQVATALKQGVNKKGDTVLHRAIHLANVPCVKALLEAGANPGHVNKKNSRALECLYRLRNRDDQYAEIIRVLLHMHPTEMLMGLKHSQILSDGNGELFCTDSIGDTTPLILAAKQKSLKMVSLLIETGLELCKDGQLVALIDERMYGPTALSEVCDVSNWNACDQEECDRILGIAKLLILHGANVNIPNDYHSSPLYVSCSSPCGIIGHQDNKLNALRLQRELICLLLQNGANANEWHYKYWSNDCSLPVVRFLDTAEFYIKHFFHPDKPGPEAEEILEGSHALFLLEEDISLDGFLNCSSSDVSNKEEDEQTIMLELLKEIFVELVDRVGDLNGYFGRDEGTLLFRTSTIPGAFGFFATQLLLEKGASLYSRDTFNVTPYRWALDKAKSTPASSLMRWWKKNIST